MQVCNSDPPQFDILIVDEWGADRLNRMLVTAVSVEKNLCSDAEVNFHFLLKNPSPAELETIKNLPLRKGISYSVVSGLPEPYGSLKTKIGKNIKLLSLLLPIKTDFLFYISTDIIVNTDLCEVVKKLGKNKILAAVADIVLMDTRESTLSHVYGWDEFSKFRESPEKWPYFNAGFFLLNVKKAKEEKIWEKAMEFLKNHPNPPYADQDILNAVIGQARSEEVVFLPPHYNVFCDFSIDYERRYERSYYKPEEITDSFRFAKIMHYAGVCKPWNYCNCHYYDEWWQYAQESPASGFFFNTDSVKVPKTKPVNFVLTGDRNYIDPILVTMTSIVKNLGEGYHGAFYLFMRGLSEKEKDRLNSIKQFYGCTVSIIDADEFENLFCMVDVSKFKNQYINIVCYYRLLMFEFLLEDVDKCYYVDGDMIINTDLSGIYNDFPDEKLLEAVVEVHAMDTRESTLSHVYDWDEFSKFRESPEKWPYFNAGFFLLNVKKAKEEKIWEKAMEFLKNHPNPPYADQDILNAVIGQARSEEVVFLPPHYNVFCDFSIDYERRYERSYYKPEEITDSFRFAKIMHYAGVCKPWNYCNCHNYDEWWQYAQESPASGSLLGKTLIKQRERCKEVGYLAHLNAELIQKNNRLSNRGLQTLKKAAVKILDLRDPFILIRYNEFCKENDVSGWKGRFKKFKFLSKSIFNSRFGQSVHDINYKKIFRLIDSCEVVSFDIFDTLVCRPYCRPTDLFKHISEIYNEPGFPAIRIEAERRARLKHPEMEDVTIDLIYDEMPADLRKFKEIEIESEIAISFVNRPVVKIYDYAVSKRKKIILASDMYLPREVILNILDKNNYRNYEKLYLSGADLMKQSGSMFDFILSDLGVSPEKILHIGDNYTSDYLQPTEKGINAVWITKNVDALLDSNIRMRMLFDSHTEDLGASILLGLIASFRGTDEKYWANFGRDYVGPVIFSFTSWMLSEFKKDKPGCILFVARDGYTLKKVFDILSGSSIESRYIYSPRRLNNICYLDYESKIKYDRLEAERTLNTLIEFYEESSGEKIKEMSFEDQVAFVDQHISQMKEYSKNKRENYAKYIRSKCTSEKVALVDTITVHFSSQNMISKSLPSGSNLKGYYWAVIETEENKDKIRNFEFESYQEAFEHRLRDWDVMEFFMTAPELPIMDISEKGEPVYMHSNKNEKIRMKVYPEVSRGAVEFGMRAKEIFGDSEVRIPNEIITDFINILCSVPTEKDIKMFGNVKHAYDSENKIYVPLFKQWYQKDV